MLIRFIVENFSSFADQAEISMVAGRQEIHPDHLIEAPDNAFKLLRTGVVYGANASGKSNLVKAMKFAKDLIVNGTTAMSRIPVRPFLLDASKKGEPSNFQFTFCHKSMCYTYGFKLNAERIQEEWLAKVVKGREQMLFERKTDSKGNAKVVFLKSLEKTAEDRDFLALVARGTRQNQLFLTESIQRNVKPFQPVWQWFAQKLLIIFPETHALGIEFAFHEKKKIAPVFMEFLRSFDTGILGIDAHEAPLETAAADLPPGMREHLETVINDKSKNVFVAGPSNMRYAIRRNDQGELVAIKLRAQHSVKGSKGRISFDFADESDGTQRIVDLLPALTSLLSQDKVVVVDEIDRSLHPHVTYAFFELFLSEASKFHSQLIATTHSVNLFTFELLRKDEIWMVEKNKDGASRLFSLEEFKPRYDKDIMKGYMTGRFGGVPSIIRVPNPFTRERVAHAHH